MRPFNVNSRVEEKEQSKVKKKRTGPKKRKKKKTLSMIMTPYVICSLKTFKIVLCNK